MQRKGFRGTQILYKFNSLPVQLGLRFFAMCVGIATLNGLLIALAMFAPVFRPMSGILGFTAEDQAELTKLLDGVSDKHKSAIKTEMEAVLTAKGFMSTKEFEEKMTALGVTDKKISELTEALKTQGETLKKLLNPGKENAGKSFDEIIEEKKDKIKALASGDRSAAFKLEIPSEAFKTLLQRAAVNQNTTAMRLPDVGQLAYLGSVMSGLFQHVNMDAASNGTIRYIDQSLIVRGADVVGEDGQKPESQIEWTEYSMTVKKIADSIPVTKEAWNDIGFIRGEIQRLLNVNLMLKEDAQFWSGSGVGNNIKGIYTYATAFVPATYAGTTPFANIYDLLAVVRVDIMNGKGGKYLPQTVVMNPVDILRLKLIKDADGRYNLPPFMMANGQVVDGMSIIESSQVTANTLIVGDFRYGTIYDAEGVTVEMGYVNDQFIKNTQTILAEKRTMLLVRNADNDAFRKVIDINAAIAGISA